MRSPWSWRLTIRPFDDLFGPRVDQEQFRVSFLVFAQRRIAGLLLATLKSCGSNDQAEAHQQNAAYPNQTGDGYGGQPAVGVRSHERNEPAGDHAEDADDARAAEALACSGTGQHFRVVDIPVVRSRPRAFGHANGFPSQPRVEGNQACEREEHDRSEDHAETEAVGPDRAVPVKVVSPFGIARVVRHPDGGANGGPVGGPRRCEPVFLAGAVGEDDDRVVGRAATAGVGGHVGDTSGSGDAMWQRLKKGPFVPGSGHAPQADAEEHHEAPPREQFLEASLRPAQNQPDPDRVGGPRPGGIICEEDTGRANHATDREPGIREHQSDHESGGTGDQQRSRRPSAPQLSVKTHGAILTRTGQDLRFRRNQTPEVLDGEVRFDVSTGRNSRRQIGRALARRAVQVVCTGAVLIVSACTHHAKVPKASASPPVTGFSLQSTDESKGLCAAASHALGSSWSAFAGEPPAFPLPSFGPPHAMCSPTALVVYAALVWPPVVSDLTVKLPDVLEYAQSLTTAGYREIKGDGPPPPTDVWERVFDPPPNLPETVKRVPPHVTRVFLLFEESKGLMAVMWR